MHASRKPRIPIAVALAAAMLGGCATPSYPNLQAARAAYDSAAADPVVVRSAPNELLRARQELERADRAASEKDDASTVNHYAYLARQRAQVAVETGKQARAEQQVADARAQRDRVVLASRTQEADTARAHSEQARMDAEAAKRGAQMSAQRAGVLEDQLAALKAKQTDRGMVLTLGDVLFDSGKATLKPGAMRTIDQLATFLQNYPQRKVLIEGYTDSAGSEAFNHALSERRADAVRDALMSRNVGFDRVRTNGMGESAPVATNDTAAGRQQNRRVEVVFSNDAGQFAHASS